MRFTVTCTERMTFFVYYVVSKGNIIDAGFMRPNKQTKYLLQLNATEKMIPKAKILVATLVNRTMVNDIVDIDFQGFRNNVSGHCVKYVVWRIAYSCCMKTV